MKLGKICFLIHFAYVILVIWAKGNNEKINILLVDDRPENLLALEVIIERDEYNLVKASSGEEALMHVLKYDFATILLDVQMPGIDGFETARIIQARERSKHIPIIFITANNMSPEHIFAGYTVGAVDYLLKPFDPFILKAKVERFVELHKMNRTLTKQAEQLEEQQKIIAHMAYHDALTELPNRRQFQDTLAETLTQSKLTNQPFALMYLDMDRFKYVNDSLGHPMGDRLLRLIAERLRESVQKHDFVGRIGGDEFVILLPGTTRESCMQIAERIIESFNSPFFLDDYELYLTTSIGISVFPFDGEDVQALVRSSDTALYRAKEKGKNRYNIYHTGMNLQSFREFVLQQDLRKAVERNEFFLVYQPRIHLESGKITSAEALLRWNHPNWGLVPPGEFIALAEEAGLMVEIGSWVLKEACRQSMVWEQAKLAPVRIAVNFSPQQFLQKDLLGFVRNTLDEYGVAPDRIEIEITESILMDKDSAITNVIQQMRDWGIKVSLDDFGSGYSSLQYLQRFPVDTIKIDKSFIGRIQSNNPASIALVSSIITLADSLNMSIIAEGVETEEQLLALKERNCEEVQGYYFCKPVAPDEFEIFIANNNPHHAVKQPGSERLDHPRQPVVLPKKKLNDNLEHNEAVIKLAIERTREKYGVSAREIEVFELIVQGLSNKDISEKLYISEHTVKNHITHIFQKLEIADRMQAMSKLYQLCMEESQRLRA